MDFSLKEPDYTILVQVTTDRAAPALLKLPCSNEKLVEICSQNKTNCCCVDCCVPYLTDAITKTGDFMLINQLAHRLSEIQPQDLSTLKALLAFNQCTDLLDALTLSDTLEDYIHSPQFKTPAAFAKGQLEFLLDRNEVELLLPYLDLERYGTALLHVDYAEMTAYGLIERRDGQPLRAMHQQNEPHKMEMM